MSVKGTVIGARDVRSVGWGAKRLSKSLEGNQYLASEATGDWLGLPGSLPLSSVWCVCVCVCFIFLALPTKARILCLDSF